MEIVASERAHRHRVSTVTGNIPDRVYRYRHQIMASSMTLHRRQCMLPPAYDTAASPQAAVFFCPFTILISRLLYLR